MPVVKIIQQHEAVIEQVDSYELTAAEIDSLQSMNPAEQEFWVMEHGENIGTETEIVDIHETIFVQVTW